jgi:hypothetical protein
MDMHDQSAGRISGRTRAAVSAMCVRALRITVLKSAGNFTRDECHDLNAEKIQRVKCFIFTRCGICCVLAIFERRRGRLGSKISGCGQLAEAAVYVALAGLPRKQTPVGSVGTSAGAARSGSGQTLLNPAAACATTRPSPPLNRFATCAVRVPFLTHMRFPHRRSVTTANKAWRRHESQYAVHWQ